MKTKITHFLILILLGISVVSKSQTLDQSQLVYDAAHSARNLPGYSTWQSFTAGITGTLAQIDQAFASNMTGTATLNIFSGTGIEGNFLYTDTVAISGIGNFWQSFIISTPILINANEIYTFQLIPLQGGGLPDPYAIQMSGPTDAYLDGISSFNPTFDYVFKTFVNSTVGNSVIESTNLGLKIYPNPFSSQTTLTSEKILENASLTICNLQGQKLMQMDNLVGKSILINRDNLPNGIYLMRLTENNKTYSAGKLLIID